ncbi:unnamed protein product [Rotaria sp. Silwood2]|nr:unnamed protein product [Rotaria sp. Silwood2]CAF2792070.1 unnamed protein product [Rotaria sp. Silwood2]CAF2919750.1 unnamed protein product [Rotaria sp. Silwood2]CAF3973227.1 unnamed protein product [Rotaria sp. Silwood2]CAF4022210.1 unnamed protein product [Rotaria sp. Silwood2]
MQNIYMNDREFYQPNLPSFPLHESNEICVTQLSPETSIQTWPCDFKTGSDIITHSFHEEVYILEGAIIDLSLGQTFGKGYHAWRNSGMKHGPYQADPNVGCQMLVIVRNPNRLSDSH